MFIGWKYTIRSYCLAIATYSSDSPSLSLQQTACGVLILMMPRWHFYSPSTPIAAVVEIYSPSSSPDRLPQGQPELQFMPRVEFHAVVHLKGACEWR